MGANRWLNVSFWYEDILDLNFLKCCNKLHLKYFINLRNQQS